MAMALKQMQPVLAFATAHLDEDLSLSALAGHAGLSAFHLQRIFSAAVGETPKQLTLRLRLGRAAGMLLMGDDSVLEVALACGFQGHEVFCRAFRRRFGITPSAYRGRGFVNRVDPVKAKYHGAIVDRVGPCIGLYHIEEEKRSAMAYSVTKKELSPQPVLVVRRRVKRSQIAAAIGEALPHVFLYAQQNGIALAGLPFTRYIEVGPGLITIEPGMRVAGPSQDPHRLKPAWTEASGGSEVKTDVLPGGPVAFTTHTGSYDNLPDAYGAIELWIEGEGLVAVGTPWESYITDPAEYPDPKDWKTEVFWPLTGRPSSLAP
jgi:AraC-like DNA-binding protein/effector-binding domain-containing protein